jgi:hypothetical protein
MSQSSTLTRWIGPGVVGSAKIVTTRSRKSRSARQRVSPRAMSADQAWHPSDASRFRVRRRPLRIERMQGSRLLNIVRQDWWWLAIVVCAIWAIECVIEGNTLFEIVMGPAMVGVWVSAIILIDRWVVKTSARKARQPGQPFA